MLKTAYINEKNDSRDNPTSALDIEHHSNQTIVGSELNATYAFEITKKNSKNKIYHTHIISMSNVFLFIYLQYNKFAAKLFQEKSRRKKMCKMLALSLYFLFDLQQISFATAIEFNRII
ncbi:CLUMA_CG020143, isoform A [Clunio marinus]|uniref:CLUMA_CG020143, isoform A n=1 Tax=Clunio marinus TaxID=568069 RepID=A0A1J1J6P1_9DIPT|nr:CLUMA_CG020143, isoform A [Clunio marinus]